MKKTSFAIISKSLGGCTVEFLFLFCRTADKTIPSLRRTFCGGKGTDGKVMSRYPNALFGVNVTIATGIPPFPVLGAFRFLSTNRTMEQPYSIFFTHTSRPANTGTFTHCTNHHKILTHGQSGCKFENRVKGRKSDDKQTVPIHRRTCVRRSFVYCAVLRLRLCQLDNPAIIADNSRHVTSTTEHPQHWNHRQYRCGRKEIGVRRENRTTEVERSLRVLDGGVVIFSAREGVETRSGEPKAKLSGGKQTNIITYQPRVAIFSKIALCAF